MEKSLLILSEANRNIFHRLLAALSFTIICYLLGVMGYFIFTYTGKEGLKYLIQYFGNVSYIIALLLVIGVRFGGVYGLKLNLETLEYKKQLRFGVIAFGRWRKLPEIEYVSVFRQPLANGSYRFEVNLWYAGNRHLKLYENYLYKELAIEFGSHLSNALKVGLLDATIPNNNRWIVSNTDQLV